MITGLLRIAIRKVYSEERAEVKSVVQQIIKGGESQHAAMAQLLVQIMNTPDNKVPITLKLIYQLIIVTLSKVQAQEICTTAHFLFLAIFHEFALLDPEFRLIMIIFKIHNLCVSLAFSSNSSLDELVPGIQFGENELDLDEVHNEGAQDMEITDFEHDNLGLFKAYKLGKFEKVMISNLGKDIEPFLYEFKLMSKLMRS